MVITLKTEEQADPGRSTADLEKRYTHCLGRTRAWLVKGCGYGIMGLYMGVWGCATIHACCFINIPASLDVIHSELQTAERNFQLNEEDMILRRDEMLAQVNKAA